METNSSSPCFLSGAQTLAHQLTPHFLRRSGRLAVLAALTFLVCDPLQAAVTELWVHRFGNVLSNSFDQASKVICDSAGDIIVAGTSYDTSGPDIVTVKYSAVDGTTLWQRRQKYGVSERYRHYDAWSLPVVIALDADGNVVVSGSTENPDNDTESEFYTAKYACATGAVLWEKRYYNSGDAEARALSVTVDRTGDVVVTGRRLTLKYAGEDGALLWRISTIGNAHNEGAAVDGEGNVVVTGSSYNADNGDYYTAKYAAADGELLWEKFYGGASSRDDRPIAVAVDVNGNVIVTGTSANDTGEHYRTIKYAAANGAVLWEQQEDKIGRAHALAVDANGNVVVTGYSEQREIDYHTVKYAAADGALLWEKHYDGPANLSRDMPQAVALDMSGNVVVTGFSTSFANAAPTEVGRPFDIYTAKYEARDGTLLWERRYESKAYFDWNRPDLGPAVAVVAVDNSGNAIVTGPSFEDDMPFRSRPNYYTAKYAAVDGTLLWEKSYDGPAVHYAIEPTAVAIDGSGNVIINANSDTYSYTAKFASNGALLWEKRVAGSGRQLVVDAFGSVFEGGTLSIAKYGADGSLAWKKHEQEDGVQIALDPVGNLVVATASQTAKYANSSGELLWKKQPSTMDRYRQTSAIAVDNNGNVTVTGSVTSRYEGYTARYAGTDGALLWYSRHAGSGYLDDIGHAIAVDSTGNAVVITSKAARKYGAADGALLWEKRYTGIYALALDGDGNVVISCSVGTLKLAATDGALLWLKPFVNGYGTALSTDGSGNVVVTGQSSGSLYTAKYASSDGSLLWERSYKEPGGYHNSTGGPRSLALGPNGMIAIIGGSYLSATGISNVLTFVYREALSALSIEPLLSGARLSFTGTAGQSYSIQRAPSVTGPWTTINTQTAPTSDLIQFEDASLAVPAAFYRTTTP